MPTDQSLSRKDYDYLGRFSACMEVRSVQGPEPVASQNAGVTG
jgi:hypothetical protein